MSNRKKMLLIGALVVAVVLMLIVTFVTNRSVQATACQDLIYAMERGEAENTYAMLSSSAREHLTLDEWREQVAFVQEMYAGREEPPELIDSTEEQSAITDEQVTTETYRVVSEFGPWQATCTMYDSSDGIGSFETDIGV